MAKKRYYKEFHTHSRVEDLRTYLMTRINLEYEVRKQPYTVLTYRNAQGIYHQLSFRADIDRATLMREASKEYGVRKEQIVDIRIMKHLYLVPRTEDDPDHSAEDISREALDLVYAWIHGQANPDLS